MSATTDLAMGKKDSRDDSESCLCSRMTKLATLPVFTLCLGAYGLTYGMLLTYYVSQVTSLEKIFGFSSEDIGWVISFYEIGHIAAVIFVGYFGHTAHRPRLLAAGAFLIGTCSILMALPNFLYTGIAVVHSNASASESFTFQRYCDQTSRNGSVGVCPEGQTTHHQKLNTGAYTIIAVAFSVAGIGPTTLWTVGISYIDDNADPKRSSFFVSE